METLNYELKLLNLSKDKFLTVISHDLHNPLRALLVSSDLLSSKIKNKLFHETEPLVKIIDRTSHNILGQLNELVAWAKIQQNIITPNPEKIHLVDAIDKFLELMKDIAAQKNVFIKINVPDNVYISADCLMLKSIFQNLVTNAIKYTKENGFVTITAKLIEQMVEVCIADTGIGMKANISKNLFTKYKSLSSTGTNNEKGTGIGLTIVKDFVTQNGGKICVKSRVSKGTNIFFTLPLG